MKKLVILVLICIILSSCSEKSEQIDTKENASFVLGFSQLGSESGWRLGNTKSIKDAAVANEVDLLYLNAEQKYDNQIKHIRRFIANQVDIIAFSPIVATGWDNVLTEARDAGIPVIITDRGIKVDDPSLYRAFIGSDFVIEGEKAGQFLLDYYSQKTDPVKIVELRGTENSTPALGRSAGFRNKIKDYDYIEIVYSEDGDFMNSRGEEIMKEVISSHIEYDVIYSHNDSMTYGAIKAIEEAGLTPGVDVIIISVDGEQKSIELLREGQINCVVECTPLIGDKLMEISSKILAGELVPQENYSEETVFTMWDNLSGVAERGY